MDASGFPTPPSDGLLSDSLYRLLVRGQLYVDLERDVLDDHARAPVFLDATDALVHRHLAMPTTAVLGPSPITLEMGARVVWDERPMEIVNIGRTRVSLQGDVGPDGQRPIIEIDLAQLEDLIASGSVRGVPAPQDDRLATTRELLDRASPDDRKEANRRYRRILAVLEGRARVSTLSRNDQRYLRLHREKERALGNGYLGLLPQPRTGNRTVHPVVVSDDVINDAIDALFPKPWQPSRQGFIRRIRSRLASEGVEALPSAGRVRRLLKLRRSHAQDVAREGSRAAYGSEPFVERLSASTPPHGTRPWEVVHLDHTELDIQVVDGDLPTRVLGRPTLTLVVDAFSRRVLAFWLGFDAASTRSDMMAFRVCVRRHNRLPDTVVTDGRPDFESVAYETFLAWTHMTKKVRPPAKPRNGSVIERLFGVNDQMLIHELAGNTKAAKKVRTLTRAVDPAGLAAWDLSSLYEALAEWFYEVYDQRVHPTLGMSPRDAYDRGHQLSGLRPSRRWLYDETFIDLTLATSPRGALTISRGVGLRYQGMRYWNELFHDFRLHGKGVPFLFDPWNLNYVRAFVDGRWVRCDAPTRLGLPPLSGRELAMVAEVDRGRRKAARRQMPVGELELGDLLRDLDDHQLQLQRRRDAATREVGVLAGVMEETEPPDAPSGASGAPSQNRPPDPAPQQPIQAVELEDLF